MAVSVQHQTLWFSESDKEEIRKVSRAPFGDDHLTCRVVSDPEGVIGYGFVDDVKGLHEMITYLAGLNADGSVRAVEILVYREAYGFEIKSERFRKQFGGKTLQDPIRVGTDIRNIAGATISTNAISAGVRKILALYEVGIRKMDPAKNPGRPTTHAPVMGSGGKDQTPIHTGRTRVVWGTTLAIDVYSDSSGKAEAGIDAAFREVDRLTPIFSRYDSASEISRINARPGAWIRVSEDFEKVFHLALEMSRKTAGFFDPTKMKNGLAHIREERPSRPHSSLSIRIDTAGVELDFDGIAKGYAVDRMVQLFKDRGLFQVLINFGESSIAAMGTRPGSDGWEVRVRDARKPESVADEALTTLMLRDGVLSVSGSYARGAHILNPFTGRPPPDSLQAVVVGPLGSDASARADALSTALFAGGRPLIESVERCGFEGLWLGPATVRTRQFSKYEKAR